jgi:hypothetical protein
MRRLLVAFVLATAALTGCRSHPTTTPRPEPTHVEQQIVIPAVTKTMPAAWTEVFAIPYGPRAEQLGTSQGGDQGGSVMFGPEYGVPAPDGSWWFLDVGKHRLAHYDATGAFLDAVKVPNSLSTGFPWYQAHVLDDGTLVAFRTVGSGGGGMLRLRDGVLDEVPLPTMFDAYYDDGSLLYGTVGRGKLMSLDPLTGVFRPVTGYWLPSGGGFTFDDNFDTGRVAYDSDTASVSLTAVSASGAIAHVGREFRAGDDGTLHVLLMGYGDDASSVQLAAYLTISPSGEITEPEPVADLYADADGGSPAHLVMAPGESSPMLVYVMDDGVHVYRRE